MEISREELYRRVWETPVIKLAAQFGLSDVGLAKLCRRHAIPTPPAGHWTKVAHGKGFLRPPLPPSNVASITLLEAVPSPPSSPVATEEAFPTLRIVVPRDVSQLAPIAASTFAKLTKAKVPESGLISVQGAKVVSCNISQGTTERAARLLDAIERALPAVNAKFTQCKDADGLCVEVDSEPVRFSLAEKYKRTEHITQDPRYSFLKHRDYTYEFTGDLRLTIDGYFDGRKSWSDGVRARLDDKLKEVILGFVAAARSIRARREEREAQRLRWEEEARIRASREEEQRRMQAFRSRLALEAGAWARHSETLAYLAFLERELRSELDDGKLAQASLTWLEIARRAAAELDPTRQRLHLLRVGHVPNSWEAPFGHALVKEPSGPC